MTVGSSSRRLLQMSYPPRPSNSPGGGPGGGSYFPRSFNSNVVVVMAVLLFALVVAAFINTVARCILRRRRPPAPEEHASTDKGLDKSVIEALPVVAFKPVHDTGSECVVCLSEFTAGEHLRLLPDCRHGFHLACVDTWLLTHTTCPVCRRSVLPCSSSPDPDPACASARFGGSSRFGSARIASARIASVDIEIEPSNAAPDSAPDPGASSSSSTTTTRPKPRFASILSTDAMASIIGSRRFGATRNQSSV